MHGVWWNIRVFQTVWVKYLVCQRGEYHDLQNSTRDWRWRTVDSH